MNVPSPPNLRLAGEKGYELQPGESFKSTFEGDWNALLGKAIFAADGNKRIKVRLMFEVEQ